MQKMFGVRFFKSYSNIAQVRKEYILLFLVNGGAQIITSGKTYELEKEDYIIINKAISGFIRKKFPFAGNFNGKRGAMFLVT